jgi:hypothetical protein
LPTVDLKNTIAAPTNFFVQSGPIFRISDRDLSHGSPRIDAIEGSNMLWYSIATLVTENEFK